jgi:hypothetical protein
MNQDKDSLAALVERYQNRKPEILDIISSESEEEFEKAFLALLEKAITHLEKNKKNFAPLGEVGLTGVLAGCFIGVGLIVTQETNSNGHVDLTIVADHCNPVITKLGEAKIFNYYARHISGLEQLLDRYLTGRESCSLLIEYVKKENKRKYQGINAKFA